MRRIDRLILKEIVGPWVFGVGLFTALLFAGGVLNKLTSYFVGGTDPLLVLKLVLLAFPAILVKTFAMSMLLAGLLGFGRLSSDSELVALKAGGASVPRILVPVFFASVAVAALAFAFNELVVPPAAKAVIRIGTGLMRSGKVAGRAASQTIVDHGKVVGFLNAQKADLATNVLQGVSVVSLDAKTDAPAWLLDAPRVRYRGVGDWRIEDHYRIVPLGSDRRGVIVGEGGAWPKGVPTPKGTLDDLLVSKDDYDSYTLRELREKIVQLKQDGNKTTTEVNDYEYGYYNKFSVALAALVFGVLGAVLGIRNHRTGTASGFALAVGIIFGYVALANFMNEWAKGGILPAWAASFAPLCIGTVACGVIIYRRNT